MDDRNARWKAKGKGKGWTIKSVGDHEREGNSRRKEGEEKRRKI